MSSGDSNGSDFVCMGNSIAGDIAVWNVERQLEKSATFNIKTCEKNILKRYEVENELNLNLNALCMFKKQTIAKLKDASFDKPTKSANFSGTRIVAGVKCHFSDVKSEGEKQAFEMKPELGPKCLLVIYAVTEAFKTSASASKPSTASSATATSNGNVSEDTMSTYSNPKNGSSLITILESSYEERHDGFDDILKFMDNKDHTPKSYDSSQISLGSTQKNSPQWTFIPKAETSEMDSLKSLTTLNGPSTSPAQAMQKQSAANKSKTENEVICFPIQTIEIEGADEDSKIKDIYTSCDNRYIIVVLQSKQNSTEGEQQKHDDDDGVDYMETDEAQGNEMVAAPFVHVLVYEVDEKGILMESVVVERKFSGDDAPVEFCILPKFDTNGRVFSGSPNESNALVITCIDGSIKVLSITTLKTLSEARVQGEKFISSVYCKNLERLCACTASGTLHFYSFYDLDSSDELEDEIMLTESNESKYAMPSTSTSSGEDKQSKTELIANRKELNLNDLKTLYSLTLFDEMLTPYSAEVPGCWTELVQAKRRHPQNMGPGDDVHLIRTWRLHNDATTFDEHLIELSLPKTTSLGHIDFKFTILQPCSNPPAIQVTLLKQKSIGLCCRRKQNSNKQTESEADVDDNINFNLNSSGGASSSNVFSSVENPVLSEEYLQARNAEILAGPIELSSCMDLNEQGGTVTFVSPKLLKSKARNYLIHLKTMTDVSKDGHAKTRGEYCYTLESFPVFI
jgi:baculoviral IAP repeat-containing protein 6